MAIDLMSPVTKMSVVKEFTDRMEPRKAFWNRYMEMIREGSTIITFYGAGGVGKSALLKKLEEEIKIRDERMGKECKYIKYDFNMGTDLREVLKTFKSQLANYGCSFPLFDMGNYCYSLKIGQTAVQPKVPTAFEQLPWVKTLKKSLSKATSVTGNALSVFNTTKTIFMATTEIKKENWLEFFLKSTISGLGMSMPIMRTITVLMSVADMFLEKYLEDKGVLDEEHEAVRSQLKDLSRDKEPIAIYEYLPTLFAMDIKDWINETGNNLIVILDNYESLISATTSTTSEQLKHDLWLRGYGGLIFMIPKTLWTIAGRNELRWDGALAEELKNNQHLITALSPKDTNWFLKKAGINNKKLRDKLVKMTEGYPIFLDLCVDFYFEYKHRYNTEPTIALFGRKREEVIGRIFRYLDAAGDDAAKDMLEFLCTLNVWTDEIVFAIARKALPNFSYNTYERVKIFSFIQSEHINNEDIDLTVFRFDKTIQSILLASCKSKIIDEVKSKLNEYFTDFFAAEDNSDAKSIFYLKLWATFTVRFINDDDNLLVKYNEIFKERVSTLISNVDFDAAEAILNLFMNRFESLELTDTKAYTYFEMDLGWLKRLQGKYSEARYLMNSAYEKRKKLLGDKEIETVQAMHKLAISERDLGNYNDAVTLQEKVLALRKKILSEEHRDTIDTMNNLAVSLGDLGHYGVAMTLQKKVWKLRKDKLGNEHLDTIAAMNNLAGSFSHIGRYGAAMTLQEKVLSLRKKILGEEHPDTLKAMNNLAISLSGLGRHSEVLKLRKKVLTLSKKILGEEHPDTIIAMNNLAISLNKLGHHGAALTLQKKVVDLNKKVLGEEHPNTLKVMHNLVNPLRALGNKDEIASVQEKIFFVQKKKFDREIFNTLDAMNNLANSMSNLGNEADTAALLEKISLLQKNFFDDEYLKFLDAINDLESSLSNLGNNDKVASLQEKTSLLRKKLLGDEHLKILNAMNNLAWTLTTLDRHSEALTLMETALPLYKRIRGEEHPDTLGCADTMAHALSGIGRHEEAAALQSDTLTKSKRIFGDNHPQTVTFMKNLAKMLCVGGKRNEARQVIEQAAT